MKHKLTGQHSHHSFKFILTLCCFIAALATGQALAGPIYGQGPSVNRDIAITPFKRVEINGPFYLLVQAKDASIPCGNLHLYSQENLLPYINIENNGDTLKISATDMIIPKKTAIHMSIDCGSVESVQAGKYAVALITQLDQPAFSADVNGGYVSLAGNLQSLNTNVRAGGLLSLELLTTNSVNFVVTDKSTVQAKQPPQHYQAEVTGKGEIHFFAKDMTKNHKEAIAPGVFLRSAKVKLPQDHKVAYNLSSYKKIKRKLEATAK